MTTNYLNDDLLDDELLALKQRLDSEDAGFRRVAVLELADLEDEAALPWLVHTLLHDPAAGVRQEAARVLAGWEQAGVVEGLCQALSDADTTVRHHAAQSLSELKTTAAGRVILPWARHDDPFVRTAALRALRELRLADSYQAALESLSDADARVRREAVGVLGWLKNPQALPGLSRLATDDPDVDVRRAATGALGLASDDSVLAALLTALADPAWQVREEAARTLGKLKFVAAADALVAALDDAYWQVRVQAARALGSLKAGQATARLVDTLTHAISNLRKDAALALGEIGDAHAIPALQQAGGDPDPEVRKAVRIALAQLRGQCERMCSPEERED